MDRFYIYGLLITTTLLLSAVLSEPNHSIQGRGNQDFSRNTHGCLAGPGGCARTYSACRKTRAKTVPECRDDWRNCVRVCNGETIEVNSDGVDSEVISMGNQTP